MNKNMKKNNKWYTFTHAIGKKQKTRIQHTTDCVCAVLQLLFYSKIGAFDCSKIMCCKCTFQPSCAECVFVFFFFTFRITKIIWRAIWASCKNEVIAYNLNHFFFVFVSFVFFLFLQTKRTYFNIFRFVYFCFII